MTEGCGASGGGGAQSCGDAHDGECLETTQLRRWSAGAQAPTAADLRSWTRQQKVALVRLVKDGALTQGFAPELWTSRRVRQMIEEKFF